MSAVWNGYTLPLVSKIDRGRQVKERAAESPGVPGEFRAGGLAAGRSVTVRGLLKAGAGVNIRDAISTMSGNLPEGIFAPLYLRGETTWYLPAEVVAFHPDESTDLVGAVPYDVVFKTAEAFEVKGGAESSATLTGSGGDVTTGGNAPAPCRVEIDVSSAPADSYITVTNTTTGRAFRIYPTTATVWVADGEAEALTTGGVDATARFRGNWPSLKGGAANAFTVTLSGGAALGAGGLVFKWRDRRR